MPATDTIARGKRSDSRIDSGSRRVKVCLASWSPFLAGAEIACERLAIGLLEAGHDVTVIVGTDGEALARLRRHRVPCIHLPLCLTDKWRWWKYLWAQRRLRKILSDQRPDVIHSNDLPTHQMVSQASTRLGIPRICHHRWIFAKPAIDWLNKFGCERHLFVSEFLLNYLVNQSPGLRERPCEVVYDGLRLPDMPAVADRAAARCELGLPTDKTLVMFAGQIVERKGVADLLRAWSMIDTAAKSRAELLIVGDDLENQGSYRRVMERLSRELSSHARFVGFQKNVPQWLTASNIAVVPSHAEPLGNATLEAMSYGLPVIGCDVGGIPEMVVGNVTGLLVPPRQPVVLAEAITRLLLDESARSQYGAAARRRCEEKFSLRTHVDCVVEQYRLVVKEESEI